MDYLKNPFAIGFVCSLITFLYKKMFDTKNENMISESILNGILFSLVAFVLMSDSEMVEPMLTDNLV
jgi:hypothetical protein